MEHLSPTNSSPSPSNNSNRLQVQANYNKLSDHIRRLTPQGVQCSVFCGGVNCKYENPENWKPDSLAIQGIYSHWITDDILAMARPSTVSIVQKNVIQQFESLGIKSIINLQCPREHASCGQPLDNSGFSYDPNIFMENNIYYYNFNWKDYGDATLLGLLNMVKVIAFAITEGRVAIHCHAGLGRTGVLISCYLVYSLRVSANDAIRYVRLKRPGSVQTKGQIVCVRHFAQFILPKTITFFIRELTSEDKYMNQFSLQRFLKRQQIYLHGYEERNFKYIPKIIHCICERMLKLCACWVDEFPPSNVSYSANFMTAGHQENIQKTNSLYSINCISSDTIYSPTEDLTPSSPSNDIFSAPSSPNPSENGDASDTFSEFSTLDGEELGEELLLQNDCFKKLEIKRNFQQEAPSEDFNTQDATNLVEALLISFNQLDTQRKRIVRQHQYQINQSQLGWIRLSMEKDLKVLAALLYEWLEGLKTPVLTIHCFEHIVVYYKQADLCFKKFPIEEGYLIEYMLRFLSKIQPISKDDQENVLKRLIAAFAHQSVIINNEVIPSEKGFKKVRDGTFNCSMIFFQSLLELVDNHHTQKTALPNIDNNDDAAEDEQSV